ncbi:MAG TPA: sensor histidine kinase [Candidatus Sulfopaludibacter sp.]|nr:sensor histidine kinase [Candidatus Sulfopaludibacter sp.]
MHSPPTDQPQSLPTTARWILAVAFLGLGALMLVSGVTALNDLDEMHAQEQSARHRFFQRTQALSGLWLSIQVYSESVQHYVVSPETAGGGDLRDRLNRLKSDIDLAFSGYPTGQQGPEVASLHVIEQLYEQQRQMLDGMLGWSADERRRRAPLLIDREIQPLQMEILHRADQLRVMNDEQLHTTDQALLAQFGELQGHLTRSIVLALGSGLLLILASMMYILRLEKQTRLRYNELVRSRGELERLSARLVDAQETERRNLSRELHDEVGQTLGALLVDFGRLSAVMGDAAPEVKAMVDHMKSVAERSVRSVRNLALLLRPSMLDDLGLVAALEWQGREVSRNSDVEVDVQSENVSEDLPDEYKVTIYRLVQEALNNAVRHSGARNARVEVRQNGRNIRLTVADDGRGFDPARSRGMGMLGMEERVRRLAGHIEFRSAPGQGTTISADLPVEAAS